MKESTELKRILAEVANGSIAVKDAIKLLTQSGFEDVGFAQIDLGRYGRCGFPEVIFAESKSAEQIVVIAKRLLATGEPLLITRLDAIKFKFLRKKLPKLEYNPQAKVAYLTKVAPKRESGILIITAGTSDIPVAEEAAVTCETLGFVPERLYDVGVAGMHRLLSRSDKLAKAKVITTPFLTPTINAEESRPWSSRDRSSSSVSFQWLWQPLCATLFPHS